MRETFEQRCVAEGLRMIQQRRVIARVIDRAHDHHDILQIHARAAQLDPTISLSTVYRTLRVFAQAGIVTRHHFADARSRFELNPGKPHDHLIDLCTGRVVEFKDDAVRRLQEAIAARLGYRLVGYRLELHGMPLEPDRRSRDKRQRQIR